ncbi:ClpXP adapter SpxH family protein [Evansella cellulosilytica]|uniref:ClpXP adapter protein SpxH n=1 Tax=Evansella cellulosilytica (strain ATCC 21833 / DSM 2522 / FERM P-1141 / JCM 9156 / N-4) TaxID=649639 RepID=E6TX60_EVAC2|nr:ClpXP adapter SpxH family protein [Evansella cellulosilytica]ADU31149.1 dithiol-disulfide isomerase involved in polyketide biosynthesis-like protein [Evansella cellulosilytica DSM 2522]
MTSKEEKFICNDELGLCCPEEPSSYYKDRKKKPIEIYMFIDPLCPECWALEPIVKKLQMEYSPYFTLRTLLANELKSLNQPAGSKKAAHIRELARSYDETATRTGMPCDGDVWYEATPTTPYLAILAIKAAELQGKAIGSKFLRRLREALFLHKQNIACEEVLIECANKVKGLDVNEFKQDLHSKTSSKAFQNDVCTTKEMEVTAVPTLVFFNDNVDEPGLNVPGLYDYPTYVRIMEDMLGEQMEKCPQMTLESFLEFYSVVTTKEISVVFDWTIEQTEKKMKKLQIMQLVERVPVKYGTLWRFIQ